MFLPNISDVVESRGFESESSESKFESKSKHLEQTECQKFGIHNLSTQLK